MPGQNRCVEADGAIQNPEWIGLESAILMANDPLLMRFSEAVRADVQEMLWVRGDSTLPAGCLALAVAHAR